MNSCARVPRPPRPLTSERGSVLLTAMLVAIVLGAGLAGYLALSFSSLRLAQRTYYLNCSNNLAEAGLEEAIYAFRLVDTGTVATTAFGNWTLSNGNASLTLPTFNCGQNAIGIVKVYVNGFDGTLAVPTAIAQASITPIGGGPVIKKTLKISMNKKGAFNAAIITRSGTTIGANAIVDSFNSNPGGGTSGTRLAYPGNGAAANGNMITLGSLSNQGTLVGSISLGLGAVVNGNVLLGSGVTAPNAAQVNGSIIPNYTGNYPTPPWPAYPTSTGSYGLTSIPTTLPRTGDVPSSDGRFYYYPLGVPESLPVRSVTIRANHNVTIYATSVGAGLILGTDATCIIWTRGSVLTVSTTPNTTTTVIVNGVPTMVLVPATTNTTGWTNPNWAGALQIYSLGSSVAISQTTSIRACIYAPLATFTFTNGGISPTFTGSIIANTFSSSVNGLKIRYDESLRNIITPVGTGWSMLKWYDLQGTAESRTLAAATGNFLN